MAAYRTIQRQPHLSLSLNSTPNWPRTSTKGQKLWMWLKRKSKIELIGTGKRLYEWTLIAQTLRKSVDAAQILKLIESSTHESQNQMHAHPRTKPLIAHLTAHLRSSICVLISEMSLGLLFVCYLCFAHSCCFILYRIERPKFIIFWGSLRFN